MTGTRDRAPSSPPRRQPRSDVVREATSPSRPVLAIHEGPLVCRAKLWPCAFAQKGYLDSEAATVAVREGGARFKGEHGEWSVWGRRPFADVGTGEHDE